MKRLASLAALLLTMSLASADASRSVTPQNQDDLAERVGELQATIASQQARLSELERQLAAGGGDVEMARSEALKTQLRELLGDDEFRKSLFPPEPALAGYDGGFFVKNADDTFKLKINGGTQFRYSYYHSQDANQYLVAGRKRDDRSGFEWTRARLNLNGNLFSKDFTYRIEFNVAPSFAPVFFWFNYRFADEFQTRVGLIQTANTRQQVTAPFNTQTIDKPMVDYVFGTGTAVGVEFHGELFNKRLDYYVDVVNTFNGAGNNILTPDGPEIDPSPAIAARVVWHALVPENCPRDYDPIYDFITHMDLPCHQDPVLDLGFHYAFNDVQYERGGTRIPFPNHNPFVPGGFGLTNSSGLQINQFGWDAAFKYRGFSLMGEYILRIQDVRRAGRPVSTPLWVLTGDDSTTAQQGAYVQAGYFLPIPGHENKVEVVGRVGGISTIAGGQEGAWEYTGGVNYYIQGNRMKLQAELTRIPEAPISTSAGGIANVNDDVTLFRVQLQVLF